MAWPSGVTRSGCWPRSTSSSAGWRKPKSGSTSPSACWRRTATPSGSPGRADGHGRHPGAHPHFRRRRLYRDGVLADRPRGGRARRAIGLCRAAAREAARGGAARAAEELMDPRALAVLIPIVALGGFFGSVIAFILSRTYL